MAALNKVQPNLDFSKICRACLQIKKDMRPLFDQLTATMLMGISKVMVSVGDGLPTQLCLQCVHQISRFHSFKEQLERNNEVLHQQLHNMNNQLVQKVQNVPDTDALKKDDLGIDCQNSNFLFIDMIPENNIDSFLNSTDNNQPMAVDAKQENVVKPEEDQKALANKEEDFNSDEENYLQMVVFQASATVAPGRHVCNLCHKEFKHARWLKQHMKSHSNWIKANCKKPPMCHICERTFKGPGMLKMHMRTHELKPPKQPTCSVCQRTFPTKTLLYRHRQTHFEQKTHQCTVCEKRFYSGYALRSHMARHRGERPYVCSMCPQRFYNHTDLKVHFRLHTGEKPLKCSECSKTFRRHSTLCQHMKKHRGIRNHVCHVCNKGFYEVSKLKAHMRVHTGEKPFECQYCERRFAQQSALIYHRRTHTGEKPYSCKICAAKFTTSSARNNHLLAHTENKRSSAVCKICLKGCSSRAELRAHMARHENDKDGRRTKFQCNVCGKGFTEARSYKRHLKTHETKNDSNENDSDSSNSENSSEVQSEKQIEYEDQTPKIQETIQEEQDHIQIQVRTPLQNYQEQDEMNPQAVKRFKCGVCMKTYVHMYSLKKHMVTHMQQPSQAQPQPTVLQVGGVQQLIHTQQIPQSTQQSFPVISSVQSLQLQQTQQQVNQQQPQQLHLQTIQLHPQQQPIQIHAVGVQQVQQQQLHVATSSCQTMLPNILQLQPGAMTVSGLGQQDLGMGHRIILQQPMNPALYTIHH